MSLQRQKIQSLIESCKDTDYATASRACDKNHSYFHQFVHRGIPHKLPEDVRHALARHLGVEEAELRPTSNVAPSPEPHASAVTIPTFEGQSDAKHSWQFNRSWVNYCLRTEPDQLRGHIVGDDAMTPMLQAGDAVLIDVSRTAPSPAGLFTIHDGVGIVIRWLDLTPNSAPPRLNIVVGNERYQSFERALSEVAVLGRVVWFSRAI